ncbi:hypothetical protein FACS1894109_10690 [Spirochaetia bacterium]|nr:hypothetical protein FACS1894109_10690 [Spirochaetia bacterium]
MKQFILLVPYVLFSVYISLLDIRTGRIPRLLLWAAILLALLLKILITPGSLPLGSLTGGLLGTALFLLAYLVSGKKLGLADVWYAGLIGIVLEPLRLYAALGVSCVLAIVFILITKKHSIPFIPFMAAGSFSMLPVWGAAN